ncbi:integrase family protein [Roseibium aggregatum]|uniref:integrase family protein n=1 Tax=Roseibium aggregatum TaxID=187304 RepID=UPI001A8DF6B1|nr:integrase family protein [Roseibium aggregatum]MBN8182023.1 integrase family protein [Roseibium aggregatum]
MKNLKKFRRNFPFSSLIIDYQYIHHLSSKRTTLRTTQKGLVQARHEATQSRHTAALTKTRPVMSKKTEQLANDKAKLPTTDLQWTKLLDRKAVIDKREDYSLGKGLRVRCLKSGERIFFSRYVTAAGVKRSVDIGTFPSMTVHAARKALGDLKGEIKTEGDVVAIRRSTPAGVGMTLRQMLAFYVERYVMVERKEGKSRNEAIRLSNALADKAPFADDPVDTLSLAPVSDWLHKEAQKVKAKAKSKVAGERQANANGRVVDSYRQVLVHAHKIALQAGRLHGPNIFRDLPSFKAPKKTGKPRVVDTLDGPIIIAPGTLSVREAAVLVHVLKHDLQQNRLDWATRQVLMTCVLVGLRVGEAANIRKADWDGKHLIVERSKTDAGVRILPLGKMDLVRDLLDEASALVKRKNGLLFPSARQEGDNAYECETLAAAARRLTGNVGEVPPFKTHDLRRSISAWFRDEGILERTVDVLMGHQGKGVGNQSYGGALYRQIEAQYGNWNAALLAEIDFMFPGEGIASSEPEHRSHVIDIASRTVIS